MMDSGKSKDMGCEDSPPRYKDVGATEDVSKEESIRAVVTCPDECFRLERVRKLLPTNGFITCPPELQIIEGHTCYDEPCGASNQLYLSVNPNKDGFELWLVINFRLPPRLHYGDENSAYKVFARRDRMEYTLHTLDVPICHHIKLNMPEVAATVDPGCFTIYGRCPRGNPDIRCKCLTPNEEPTEDYVELNRLLTPGTGVWKHYQTCTACALQGVETAFAFKGQVQTHDVKKQEFIVWADLEVRVNLGTLHNSRDPAWVLHTVEQAEIQGTSDAYRRWLDGFQNHVNSLFRGLGYPLKEYRGCHLKDDRSKSPEGPVQQYGCSIM